MSVTTYSDIAQHSDEWYELRRGIVTASTVGQLITPKTVKPADNPGSRALIRRLAAERINGWSDDTYQSYDMMRGTLDEPVARQAYAARFGEVAECGFMVTDDYGPRLGCSPDGLVGEDGMVEIKSRRPAQHLAHVIADAAPPEHMAQLQTALLVSGRDWIDYVSFCGGMHLWVKRVTPDPRWRDAIVQAVCDAEDAILQVIEAYRRGCEGMPLTERTDFESFYNVELRLS